jgi:predicted DCC family thiol-disulfide oxidoreductase YuxK
MPHAWTGGQYSMFRALLGFSLAGHFAWLLLFGADLLVLPSTAGIHSPVSDWLVEAIGPASAGEFLRGMLVLGIGLQLLLAVGWRDRASALVLALMWASLCGRDPRMPVIGQAIVILLLLLHAAMPRAPYGSLEAYGRLDPRGHWKHNSRLWGVGWCVLAVVCGVTVGFLLASPLVDLWAVTSPQKFTTWVVLASVLLLIPLVLLRSTRPWFWTLSLGAPLAHFAFSGSVSAAPAILLLDAFTFDPRWVGVMRGQGSSTIYYDGECGLCHRFVRLLLAEDSDGRAFRFAPLHGKTFTKSLSRESPGRWPDSLVVCTPNQDFLLRSDAVRHCLNRLGGAWRLIGWLLGLLPRPLRDWAYDGLASVRKSFFATPESSCPALPPDLQRRFLP